MLVELSTIPLDEFAMSIWGQLALAAAGAFSKYKKGKADEKFAEQQTKLANEEARDRWNMQQEEYYAQTAAKMKQMQGQAEAGRAMLSARQDAFGLTKESEEAEQDQRDKFAKALVDFGATNKKVNLEASKAKRSGRASRAARGANIVNTAGRAGRMSGAFRSGAKAASKAGLTEAGITSGMRGGLLGYGADLDREMGLLSGLKADGAVVGEQAKRLDNLARLRETLGGREQAALMDQANAGYAKDSVAASLLNQPGPTQTFTGKPNYGIWDNVGDLATLGSAAYGIKNNLPAANPSLAPNQYTGINPNSTRTDNFRW